MTEKNKNLLLVAGIMLSICFGCLFYLQPVSYRSSNGYEGPTAPSIESLDENDDDADSLTGQTEAPAKDSPSTDDKASSQPAENSLQPESEKNNASQSCLASGGRISTSLCCASSEDFPSSCLIGACGCSPNNSKAVMICECGNGECFDGEKCVNLEE